MFQKTNAFIYLLFISVVAFSQHNSLVILSETGTPFFLDLNSEKINKSAECNVKAVDLNYGWQRVSIMFAGNDSKIYTDSILISEKTKFVNKEFTYVLSKKPDAWKLQFKSVSELSGPKTPVVPEAPKETAPIVDNSIYGNLYQAVKNKPVFYENYDKETFSCKTKLTDKDVKYGINLLNKVNDMETAFKYLTKIIENNCYSTLQLIQLIETTPIDMDKLNSAKKGYSHLTDPENANTLISALKYQSMKDAYSDFLKEQSNLSKQKKLNCKEPANNAKFDEIFTKIKNTTYEHDKVKASKNLMTDVCLSSEQIKKIGNLYTHDREKLDYMKYAINILTDSENLLSLADEFQQQSTKDEFLKYINH